MTTERETLVAKGKRAKQERKADQEIWSPEIPRLDEFGFETLDFKCWKCGRHDYREKNTAEAFIRNGHKLLCTVCARPELWEWKTETLLDGTKREYLHSKTARETHNSITEEAHALAQKQSVVQILRDRRDAILRQTAQLEVEYLSLLPAIEQAEKDMMDAEMLVSAMEKDQVGKKITDLEDLNAKVKRLVMEIEAAKKSEQESTGGKTNAQ